MSHIEIANAECNDRNRQSNIRDWLVFQNLILTSWCKGAIGFVEVGKHLDEAEAELDRDVYQSLVKLKLPFNRTTASRLKTISRNSVICSHVNRCPPHWGTMYELTQIPAEMLKAWFEDGTVHPGLQRKDVVALRKSLEEPDPEGETETAASEIEDDPPKPETLLEHWQRETDQAQRTTLIDHLNSKLSALKPYLGKDTDTVVSNILETYVLVQLEAIGKRLLKHVEEKRGLADPKRKKSAKPWTRSINGSTANAH